MADDLKTTLEHALAGDAASTSALVRELLPVVQVRVYRSLVARSRAARGRDVRQEIEDIAQEVLCRLFIDDARVLRSWDAARGLSIRNFVGLVAEREAGHVMRSGRRSPWTHDPVDSDELARVGGTTEGADGALASRDVFDAIWERLKEQLSPRGCELFQWLVVDERSVEDVCEAFAMQPDAVYAWRSRMLKRVREIAAQLDADSSSGRAAPPATPLRPNEAP